MLALEIGSSNRQLISPLENDEISSFKCSKEIKITVRQKSCHDFACICKSVQKVRKSDIAPLQAQWFYDISENS